MREDKEKKLADSLGAWRQVRMHQKSVGGPLDAYTLLEEVRNLSSKGEEPTVNESPPTRRVFITQCAALHSHFLVLERWSDDPEGWMWFADPDPETDLRHRIKVAWECLRGRGGSNKCTFPMSPEIAQSLMDAMRDLWKENE